MADLIPVDHVTQSRDRSIFEFEDKPIIQAILKAMASGVQDVEDLIKLFHNLNLDNSSGIVLDEIYGELFNVKRIGRNDDQYKSAILAKISTFGADGTFERLQNNFERITSSPLVTIYEHYPADVHIHLGGNHSAYTILDAKALTLAGVSARLLVDNGFNSFVMAETFEMDADLQVNQGGIPTDLQVKVGGIDTDLQLKGAGTLEDTSLKARLAEIDINGVLISEFNPLAELIWGEHQIPDPLVIKLGIVQTVVGDMTLSANGFTGISGTLLSLIPPSTLSSSGAVIIRGSLSASLDDNTSTSEALLNITGNLVVTTQDIISDATASGSLEGTLALSMGNTLIQAVGSSIIPGTLTATLANSNLLSNGGVTISGSSSLTLGSVIAAASGGLGFSGDLGIQLENSTLSATAGVLVQGSLSIALENHTIGSVGSPVIVGTLAETLEVMMVPPELPSALVVNTAHYPGRPRIYDGPNLTSSRVIDPIYDAVWVDPVNREFLLLDRDSPRIPGKSPISDLSTVTLGPEQAYSTTNDRIVFNRQGTEFFQGTYSSAYTRIYDSKTLAQLEGDFLIPFNFQISDAAWSADGSILAFTNGEYTGPKLLIIRRGDFSEVSFTLPEELDNSSDQHKLQFDPQGRYLCVTTSRGSSGQSHILLLDTTSEPYTPILNFIDADYGVNLTDAKFSPDGNYLAIVSFYIGSATNILNMYDTRTMPFTRLPPPDIDSLGGFLIEWSSDGTHLVTLAPTIRAEVFAFDGLNTTKIPFTHEPNPINASWFKEPPNGTVGT